MNSFCTELAPLLFFEIWLANMAKVVMFLHVKINKGSKFFVSRESRLPGLDTVLGKQEAQVLGKTKI